MKKEYDFSKETRKKEAKAYAKRRKPSETAQLNESSLKKDWMKKEEDSAWKKL